MMLLLFAQNRWKIWYPRALWLFIKMCFRLCANNTMLWGGISSEEFKLLLYVYVYILHPPPKRVNRISLLSTLRSFNSPNLKAPRVTAVYIHTPQLRTVPRLYNMYNLYAEYVFVENGFNAKNT